MESISDMAHPDIESMRKQQRSIRPVKILARMDSAFELLETHSGTRMKKRSQMLFLQVENLRETLNPFCVSVVAPSVCQLLIRIDWNLTNWN